MDVKGNHAQLDAFVRAVVVFPMPKQRKVVIRNLVVQLVGGNRDQKQPVRRTALQQDEAVSGIGIMDLVAHALTEDFLSEQEGLSSIKDEGIRWILKVIVKIVFVIEDSHFWPISFGNPHPSYRLLS